MIIGYTENVIIQVYCTYPWCVICTGNLEIFYMDLFLDQEYFLAPPQILHHITPMDRSDDH